MVRKRDLIIAVLITFCLTATLFLMKSTRSQAPGQYDPWLDVNDDGKILIEDVAWVAKAFGTTGDPVNKTALLYNVNDTFTTLLGKIDSLNATVIEQQNIINILNSTKLGKPDYDSGWIDITDKCGQYFNITHNLNSTDVMVNIIGKTVIDGGVHQMHFGLTAHSPGWVRSFLNGQPVALVQTDDGGYAMASVNGSDIVKTDENGYTLWKSSWSSGMSFEDIVATPDGGYALTGYNQPPDFVLIKRDANGGLQWNKTYGGSGYDFPMSVIQTDDGGYAMVGSSNSFSASYDLYLVKTDANGNLQWSRTFGGAGDDYAESLIQTTDGGYAIIGWTNSFGAINTDFWLVRCDPTGNKLWDRLYGELGYDNGNDLVQTDDGGFAVTGTLWVSWAKLWDIWLFKTDMLGNMLWNMTYGGVGQEDGRSLIKTQDGGYAVCGDTNSTGAGKEDFYVVKTDAFGTVQWNRTYGQQGNDYALSLVQTRDGEYVLAGSSWSSDYTTVSPWLVKVDAESGLAWTGSALNAITLYRGATDEYWNFVRVQIWKRK